MKIKHFLQLIRYKNLLMLGFVQLLFAYFLNAHSSSYNLFHLFLLIASTLFIATAGNIINDVFDVEIDRINKPKKLIVSKHISIKFAKIIYGFLNTIGLLLGFYLCYLVNQLNYLWIFVGIIIALYYYSKSLKGIALLGNIIVSLLIGITVLMVYLFHFPNVAFQDKDALYSYFIVYSVLAFSINLLREILKDIEDIDGDYSQGLKTLPILIGRKRTQQVLFYLAIILFFGIILLISASKKVPLQLFSFVFIIIPLGYFMYKIKDNESNTEIPKLSTLLKIIMLFGMLSVLFLP